MKCALLNERYWSIKSYQDKFYVCLYVKIGVCETERYVFINYTHDEKYLCIILQLCTSIGRELMNPCKEPTQQPVSGLWHPGNECCRVSKEQENLPSIPLLLEIACSSLRLKDFPYTSARCSEAVLRCTGSSHLCI